VSKALLISRDTRTVRAEGFLLNPSTILLFILCKAVVVEWFLLKPCWQSSWFMLFVIDGRMIFSNVLMIGDNREIGLYEVPSFEFFPGFNIGTIFEVFQICGMMFSFMARL